MKPEQIDLVGGQINFEAPQHVREATDKYETNAHLKSGVDLEPPV